MEIRTLLFLNLVLLCFYALGLAVVQATSPAMRSIRWLIPVFASGAAAMLGMCACTPREPCFVAIQLTLLSGYILLHRGVLELTGAPAAWPYSGAVLFIVQLAGGVYLLFDTPSIAPRIALYHLLVAAQLALSMYALLRRMQAGLRAPTGSLAFIFLVGIAYHLLRTGASLAASMQPDRAPALVIHQSDLVVMILFSTGVLFGFLWMSTEKMRLELERMARTDSLTGVLNRRAFEAEFMREISRSLRNGAPLSMLLLDVDHFKIVNDIHGHAAGDAVLCELAAILQRDLRRADLVARLGGEEFAALLPDTDVAQAAHTAERLRAVIESTQITAGSARMAVTASFGVTAWQGDADGWSHLLQRVDSAMYRAKQAGRNQVQMV